MEYVICIHLECNRAAQEGTFLCAECAAADRVTYSTNNDVVVRCANCDPDSENYL